MLAIELKTAILEKQSLLCMYSTAIYHQDNCREIKLADSMIAIYLKLTMLMSDSPPPQKMYNEVF